MTSNMYFVRSNNLKWKRTNLLQKRRKYALKFCQIQAGIRHLMLFPKMCPKVSFSPNFFVRKIGLESSIFALDVYSRRTKFSTPMDISSLILWCLNLIILSNCCYRCIFVQHNFLHDEYCYSCQFLYVFKQQEALCHCKRLSLLERQGGRGSGGGIKRRSIGKDMDR